MSRLVLILLAVLGLGALVTPAPARVPPMSAMELHRRADLIAVGRVVRVANDGKPYSDRCYRWQNRRATFSVARRHKGTSSSFITIVYPHRVGHVDPARRCVGGRTSYSLAAGKIYKLYLRRSGTAKRPRYSFLNWAGVIQRP